nr:MAG TPA: hypothetical protein [Caudoviricetes sp.]
MSLCTLWRSVDYQRKCPLRAQSVRIGVRVVDYGIKHLYG